MKNNKRNRMLIIALVLFASIFAMTLVYAVLSTTLDIKGSADVVGSSWDINISKASEKEIRELSGESENIVDNFVIEGDSLIISSGEIKENSVQGIDVSVTKPGDMVGGIYKITNDGDIPAKLSSVSLFDVSFSSSSNHLEDIEWAQNSIVIDYDLGDSTEGFFEGDILCPGESIFVLLIIGIDNNVSTIPVESIDISNIGIETVFVQEDLNVCN